MCDWIKSGENRIDPCMKEIVSSISVNGNFTALSSCCGHGKHHKTIVVRTVDGRNIEYYSGVTIPRKKRFYFRDMEDKFFIPEVEHYYSEVNRNERCLNTIASLPFYIWEAMRRYCKQGTCENNCPIRADFCAKGNLLLYASYRRGSFGNKVPPIFSPVEVR